MHLKLILMTLNRMPCDIDDLQPFDDRIEGKTAHTHTHICVVAKSVLEQYSMIVPCR